MATAYLHKGRNDVSGVSAAPGAVWEIIVPAGHYWRPGPNGTIDVLPRWWRRALDWMLRR